MSKEEGIAFCEKLFAKVLDGHKLMSNASHLRGSAQWIRFPRVVCKQWVHHNGRRAPVVLMGDAAHTAHFSIGSGTKLALEDAIALANDIARIAGDLSAALDRYVASRSIDVLRIQNAARNSTEWFENVGRYTSMEAEQFAYSLLTRSQRISHENLRLRDQPLRRAVRAVAGGPRPSADQRRAADVHAVHAARADAAEPRGGFADGAIQLRGRRARRLSPGASWRTRDGRRGAGVCGDDLPSADGRITPGCTGLYNDAQEAAWKRIVDFVHANSTAKIAMQLGHAGAKGSTRRGWEGIDQPLEQGNWPLISASEQQYLQGVSQVSRAMDARGHGSRAGRLHCAATTRRAVAAGFDWLELHCAHGYLLSSFLSPLTNKRQVGYGGSLENRLRYPLEVFRAMRAIWPADKPMSVRISAQ